MKKTVLVYSFLMFLTAFACVSASAQTSVYTSLSDKVCKKISVEVNEGGDYHGRCPGVGGYKLDLFEGDLRQSLDIIAPNKKSYQLNLWTVVSSGFSALGEKAEWRVSGAGKAAKPTALIVRFNAADNAEHSEQNTSYLVIVKITKTSACVTDVVKPSANANVEARKLADASANKPCKTND